jgi:hypothetical protein
MIGLKTKRFEELMDTMKQIMCCKTHRDVDICIKEVLPEALGYEFASMLFSDNSKTLYSYTDCESLLPIDPGLSGIVIKKKQPQGFMDGEENKEFVMEIDNTA